MYFEHSSQIWQEYPQLVPGVAFIAKLPPDPDISAQTEPFLDKAKARLAAQPESQFPEIQAWRRTFSQMGLKPTQYRCASESLLRRLRKEDSLPVVHPVIDVCNAISVAYAIPVAVFDTAQITGGLQVRHATGDETYEAFSGEVENPSPDEIIFADEAGQAHARRWTNRQARTSAVGEETSSVLIVAEAMHESATTDIRDLLAALVRAFEAIAAAPVNSTMLSSEKPRFTIQ